MQIGVVKLSRCILPCISITDYIEATEARVVAVAVETLVALRVQKASATVPTGWQQ